MEGMEHIRGSTMEDMESMENFRGSTVEDMEDMGHVLGLTMEGIAGMEYGVRPGTDRGGDGGMERILGSTMENMEVCQGRLTEANMENATLLWLHPPWCKTNLDIKVTCGSLTAGMAYWCPKGCRMESRRQERAFADHPLRFRSPTSRVATNWERNPSKPSMSSTVGPRTKILHALHVPHGRPEDQ